MNSQQLEDLFSLILEVNEETEHDVFFSYSPHTDQIIVVIYLEGWREEKEPFLNETIYLSGDLHTRKSKDMFNHILLVLTDLLNAIDPNNSASDEM